MGGGVGGMDEWVGERGIVVEKDGHFCPCSNVCVMLFKNPRTIHKIIIE